MTGLTSTPTPNALIPGGQNHHDTVERLWSREKAIAKARLGVGLSAERSLEWLLLLSLARDAAIDREPDVATLTAQLVLPRSTVRRGLDRLEARNAVRLKRCGKDARRLLVQPGPSFSEIFTPLLEAAAAEVASGPLPEGLRRMLVSIREAALVTDMPAPGTRPVILGVNQAFQDLTGYSAATVLGRSPRMLQGPETDAASRRLIRTAIDARQGESATLWNYRQDGSAYLCHLTISPMSDDQGQPAYFLGLARNLGSA